MNILIFSQSRTGSSYLMSMFRSSNIHFLSYPEPFGSDNMNSYSQKYVRNILKTIKKTSNVLCKEHFYNFDNRLPDVDKTAFLNNNWYIISLLRKDLVEATLSDLIARHTNLWYNPNYKFKEKFIIAEHKFLKDLKLRVNRVIKFAEWQQQNKLVNEFIYYEDLTFDFKKDYKNLKLSNIGPNINTITFKHNKHKQSPTKDSILINYDRLKQIGLEQILTVSHPYIDNNNSVITLK